MASNEANLEAKIEKKKVELDRNQKRLLTLKKVNTVMIRFYICQILLKIFLFKLHFNGLA